MGETFLYQVAPIVQRTTSQTRLIVETNRQMDKTAQVLSMTKKLLDELVFCAASTAMHAIYDTQ